MLGLFSGVIRSYLEPDGHSKTTNETASHHGEAACKLDIVIVGGGVGGMSAGYLLGKAGHRVTILEAAGAFTDIGAGVQIAPNLSRLLIRWGLKEKLDSLAVQPESVSFRRWNGERVGMDIYGPKIEKEYGVPHYQAHRADIIQLLYNLASPLVHIRTNSRVASVSPDPSSPYVVLLSGEVVHGDIIIGADGIKSVVRTYLVDGPDLPMPSGDAAFRATISTEGFEDDPDLKPFFEHPETTVWMGHNRHAIGYNLRGNKIFNLVMMHPDTDSATESWTAPGEVDEMFKLYEGWAPALRKMQARVKSVLRLRLMVRQPLKDWVHPCGRITLLGDACHPMLIEDAAVLGNLFTRITEKSQIPGLLRAYQSLRYDRDTAVQLASQGMRTVLHLPDGPEQEARDAGLRQAMELILREARGEEILREAYDKNLNAWIDKAKKDAMLKYDADQAVEEWWKVHADSVIGATAGDIRDSKSAKLSQLAVHVSTDCHMLELDIASSSIPFAIPAPTDTESIANELGELEEADPQSQIPRSVSPAPTEILDDPPVEKILETVKAYGIKVRDFAAPEEKERVQDKLLPVPEIFDPSRGLAEFEYRLHMKKTHRPPIAGKTTRRLLDLGWISQDEVDERCAPVDIDALKEYDARVERDIQNGKGVYPWCTCRRMTPPDKSERSTHMLRHVWVYTSIDRARQHLEELERRDQLRREEAEKEERLAEEILERRRKQQEERAKKETDVFVDRWEDTFDGTARKRSLRKPNKVTGGNQEDEYDGDEDLGERAHGSAKRIRLSPELTTPAGSPRRARVGSSFLTPHASPPYATPRGPQSQPQSQHSQPLSQQQVEADLGITPPEKQYPAPLSSYDLKIYPEAAHFASSQSHKHNQDATPPGVPREDTPPAEEPKYEESPGRMKKMLRSKLGRTQTLTGF